MIRLAVGKLKDELKSMQIREEAQALRDFRDDFIVGVGHDCKIDATEKEN